MGGANLLSFELIILKRVTKRPRVVSSRHIGAFEGQVKSGTGRVWDGGRK